MALFPASVPFLLSPSLPLPGECSAQGHGPRARAPRADWIQVSGAGETRGRGAGRSCSSSRSFLTSSRDSDGTRSRCQVGSFLGQKPRVSTSTLQGSLWGRTPVTRRLLSRRGLPWEGRRDGVGTPRRRGSRGALDGRGSPVLSRLRPRPLEGTAVPLTSHTGSCQGLGSSCRATACRRPS